MKYIDRDNLMPWKVFRQFTKEDVEIVDFYMNEMEKRYEDFSSSSRLDKFLITYHAAYEYLKDCFVDKRRRDRFLRAVDDCRQLLCAVRDEKLDKMVCLNACAEISNVLILVRNAIELQGVLSDDFHLPKLVLLSEKSFEKMSDTVKNREKTDFNLDVSMFDFSYLFASLDTEVRYCVFIQSEQYDRFGFCVEKSPKGDIRVSMTDIGKGHTKFVLAPRDVVDVIESGWVNITPCCTKIQHDGVFSNTVCESCIPVNKEGVKGFYCNARPGECRLQRVEKITAVLLLLQEFLRKREERTNKTRETKVIYTEKRAYVPQNAIRIYDFYTEKELRENAPVHAIRYGTHTEKSPHIRKATIRYNPKTGKRDIPVRSTIIHKDKYTGFTSANRINIK